MKKIVSVFLIAITTICLCGCTKAKSATLTTIATQYQVMANNNVQNGFFLTGNVVEGGAHFSIVYSAGLSQVVSQLDKAEYTGDNLTKYERYGQLSDNGIYELLINSMWNTFYNSANLFKTYDVNNKMPQSVRTNLYKCLTEVNKSINNLVSAKRNLEAVTLNGMGDIFSSASQNSLTNYFSKFNDLLIKSLKFNVEFDVAIKYERVEPQLCDLPVSLGIGNVKVALDRSMLTLSQYYVHAFVLAKGGFDNLSESELNNINTYKEFYNKYQNATEIGNAAKFENLTGKDASSDENRVYSSLRERENELNIELPIFIISTNAIKNATTDQKVIYQNNIDNFTSNYLSYYNCADQLLDYVVNS